MNVITSGSEISGVSYSAAKRYTRHASNPEVHLKKTIDLVFDHTISFNNNEQTELLNPHHDALVISLHVANCLIKRILIDNGSSMNVLFLEALREMQIDESTSVRRSIVLVGFSGEHKNTIG
ncbi:hypothetical protein ACOSQ4_009246 [Xanthoceras sorbifolium]